VYIAEFLYVGKTSLTGSITWVKKP